MRVQDSDRRVLGRRGASAAQNGTASKNGAGRFPTVSVVIPALNEAENLPHVLATLPGDIFELVLVDGNSLDGTATVAQEHKQGTLAVVQFKGRTFTRPLAILHRKGRVLTPAMKKFIEVSNQHTPYLLRKAQRIEEYLNQR